MLSDIILAAILGWAFLYASYKAYKAYLEAKSDKPSMCLCSGCSGGCKSQKK